MSNPLEHDPTSETLKAMPTRAELIAEPVAPPPSPAAPEPTAKAESVEDGLNARLEAIRRRPQ